jgi:CBS domain-containing protein
VRIADILRHKGSSVVAVAPDDTVNTALARLAEHNIGAVLVLTGDAEPGVAGIVSERDIARQLHARGSGLLTEPVSAIMTGNVISCRSTDSVDSVAAAMTERRVRHMPVLDDGRLLGIVSIGDVVLSRMRQLEQDSRQLEQYITG